MCLCRRLRVGGVLDGATAILLAGERSGDKPAGVRSEAAQTPAVSPRPVLAAHSVLGLRASAQTLLQPARLLAQVHIQLELHKVSLIF